MRKQPKKYPMDGPPRHIQTLMMSPRKNSTALAAWLKNAQNVRPETAALCKMRK